MLKAPYPIRKTRSPMGIIKVSLLYLSSNARTLLASLAVFALPLIIVAQLLGFYITDSRYALSRVFTFRDTLSKNSFLALMAVYVIYLLGLCLFNLSVNKHLHLSELNEDPREPTFDNLKKDLAEDLKNFLISFLFLFAIYFAATEGAAYFLRDFNISDGIYDSNNTAAVSYFIEQLINFSPTLIVAAVCLFFCMSALFVSYRDHLGATEAIKKVWHYLTLKPLKALPTSIFALLIAYLAYWLMESFLLTLNSWLWTIFGLNAATAVFTMILKTAYSCFIVLYFQVSMILLYGSIEDEADGYYIKNKIENV